VPPRSRIPEKADRFGFEFKNVTPTNKTQTNQGTIEKAMSGVLNSHDRWIAGRAQR
jgi:hypothetical protein